MWHEARKQEKMIRGLIVDYRRRAERRKDFYEKIKADPTQFLQIHGRPCKVHLDPAVASAGEGPAIMMPWQGDSSNMIDRFDVRAHLDYIPEVKNPEVPPEDLNTEERHCNYERYRILAQNSFLGMGEDKFLQQLAIEEQFGVSAEEKEHQRENRGEKRNTGAAIGYNYNDPGAHPSSSNGAESKKMETKDSDEESDLDILDVDLSLDVNKMEPSQAHALNAVGPHFGMAGCDLFSFLTGDADDAEQQKQLMREEKEKAMYSGRKSRRERRAHRDKKLLSRVVSPPSYAAPADNPGKSPSRSPSRSPSPPPDQIQFITSFGGDEDDARPPLPSKPLYSEKAKQNLRKLYSEVAQKPRARSPMSEENYPCPIGPRGPDSRSQSRSKSRSKSRSPTMSRSPMAKSRSRSRYTSRSISRSRSRSMDSSRRSRSRSRSRSSSRARSRNYRSRRSRSPYSKRKKSRSISYDSSSDRGESKSNVPRYYGRRKEDRSSSELSVDSASSDSEGVKNKLAVGNKPNANVIPLRSSGSTSKAPSRGTRSLKEKLKMKMQAQLSRQLRADKRAEAERVERESRRQMRRDEEMRELALKLRRKHREQRHRYRRSSDESDRSRSRSSSRDSAGGGKKSRSRSKSPKEKRPAVWEKGSAPYKDHSEEPPLPPLPPLHTLPPPPFVRKRIPDDYKPYNADNKGENCSKRTSPRRIPVWESSRETHRPQENPFPEPRKRFDENRTDYRHENAPRRFDNRYDQNRYEQNEQYRQYEQEKYNQNQYDPRWETSRRPYDSRGYREYNRPPLPPGVGPANWQRDDQDYDDKSNVKLVDY